jgi:SAM-dependent methyltransferase
MRQFVKYMRALPRPLVRGLRNLSLGLLDLRDRLIGLRDDLIPPRQLHFVGGGDFKAIGQAFVGHFVQICSLKPDETVLDIGCGTGRMAIPLLRYLDGSGAYVGFDVSREAIRWCRDHITSRNALFSFVHADIRNMEYNANGGIAASEYIFPCGDESIDFAFATSVFTHLRANDVKRYLSEIRRVLKPAGRAMLTFYIIDEMARRLMDDDKASLNFDVNLMDCFTIDGRTPERAIAYSESQLMEFLREAKLAPIAPVHYGSWSGRPSMLDAQDVVVVKKA